jgi:hypothetical protein
VFERNLLGRAFYAKLGFEFMHQKVHNQTGFELIRLRLAANNPVSECVTVLNRGSHDGSISR